MDPALSDLLTCPRCGPTYGLILLPTERRGLRVVSGLLACANCRERYRVEGEVADLRSGAVGGGGDAGMTHEPGRAAAPAPDREAAIRLAALMGIAEARGTVLLAGPAAAHAALLGELVPGVSVVAVGGGGGGGEGGGASWVRLTTVLPFRDRSLRGVALTGGRAGLVEEGARVLGLAGQLVLEPAPADARTRVEAAGLTVLAEEGGTLVAGRRR